MKGSPGLNAPVVFVLRVDVGDAPGIRDDLDRRVQAGRVERVGRRLRCRHLDDQKSEEERQEEAVPILDWGLGILDCSGKGVQIQNPRRST